MSKINNKDDDSSLTTIINQEGHSPIIFYDDYTTFRELPKSKFWNIKYYFKQILNILLPSYREGKTSKDFLSLNQLLKRGIPNQRFNLIIKENYSDYRVHSSREAKCFKEISKEKPAHVITKIIDEKSEDLVFSLFLNKQLRFVKNILIEGYIQNIGDYKKTFRINVDQNGIDSLSHPTYWLDLKIGVNYSDLPSRDKPINLFLTNLVVDYKENNVGIIPFKILSSEINSESSTTTKKQILLLSFDGITTDDLLNNEKSTELFPSISKFAKTNHWFRNAITSSTVTASSAASLITGLNLPRHLIYNYEGSYNSPNLSSISTKIKTLGQKMREKNIPSYGLFTYGRWTPQYGLSRGFSNYRSVNSGALQNYPWLEESIKLISNNKSNSFLFAMHHPGGHSPFISKISDNYDNAEFSGYIENMKYVDTFFCAILDYLKSNDLYDNTLIIFVADHGRSLRSEFNRRVFQFTEDRLRVPLIIKHPNWETVSPTYDLDKHTSAQTTIHEIISDFIGFDRNNVSDSSLRLFDGITWVCETVDYEVGNSIGLVGYDSKSKYTIYYEIDFQNYKLGNPRDIKKYNLDKFSIAQEGMDLLDPDEREKVIVSSKNYISKSLNFSKYNRPQSVGKNTSMFYSPPYSD